MKKKDVPYAHEAVWRIERIDWRKDGLRDTYDVSRMSCLTCLGICVILLSFLVFPLIFLERFVPLVTFAIVITGIALLAPLGIRLMMLGLRLSARRRYKYWQPVQAVCLDREIKLLAVDDGDVVSHQWHCRLLCEYVSSQGQTYTVTPRISAEPFHREKNLQKYLANNIDVNNTCTLWINPENPLHTCFAQLPRM